MKKKYIAAGAATAALLGLYLCSDSKLPEGFDRTKTINAAEGFIAGLNSRDYEGCYEQLGDIMKDTMSKDKFIRTFSTIDDSLGDFVELKSASVSQSKALGVDYAVCTVKCQYANAAAVYTISHNVDMEIGGLYVK